MTFLLALEVQLHGGLQVSAVSMSMLYHMAVVDTLTLIRSLDLHVICHEALEGSIIWLFRTLIFDSL